MPSLDEGEKQGKANPRGMAKPKVVPVDFQARDRVGSEAGGGKKTGAMAQEGQAGQSLSTPELKGIWALST